MGTFTVGDLVLAKLVVAYIATDGTVYLQPDDGTDYSNTPPRVGPPTLTLTRDNQDRLEKIGAIVRKSPTVNAE